MLREKHPRLSSYDLDSVLFTLFRKAQNLTGHMINSEATEYFYRVLKPLSSTSTLPALDSADYRFASDLASDAAESLGNTATALGSPTEAIYQFSQLTGTGNTPNPILIYHEVHVLKETYRYDLIGQALGITRTALDSKLNDPYAYALNIINLAEIFAAYDCYAASYHHRLDKMQ